MRTAREIGARLTDSEISLPACVYQGISWWLEPLWTSLAHLRQSLPRETTRPLLIESACVGTFSESMVLKALGIPFQAIVASDKKAAAQKFIKENSLPVEHVFASFEEQIAGHGFCKQHAQDCGIPLETLKHPDILIAGFPCQPFSTCRVKSGTTARTGHAGAHPDSRVGFNEIADLLSTREPKTALFEQVKGFDSAQGGYLDKFIDEILSRHFAAIRVVELNLSTWCTATRDRFRMWCPHFCTLATPSNGLAASMPKHHGQIAPTHTLLS